jgi:hypothetical protein
MMRSTPIRLSAIVAALVLTACEEGKCLWYEYGPEPARVELRNAETGEIFCSKFVFTDRGAPVFHTNDSGTDCEYEIPGWYSAEGDAGPSSTVTITLESCFIQEVTFPVERDDCDQIQTPPLQVVEVTFDGDDCPGG